MKNKKAQQVFGMSFSVIFSIFLAVIIIVVAFFVIRAFMGWGKCTQTTYFIDDLQKEINKVWRTPLHTPVDSGFKSNVPSGITHVCFGNLNEPTNAGVEEREIYLALQRSSDYNDNMFFYPAKKACTNSEKIEHIALPFTNPTCFKVKKGDVEIKLIKDYTDTLVSIE